MILGAHLSVAGGVDKAVERAGEYGFETVAIFVRNQLRWRARPLGREAVAAFRRARRRLGIGPVVAHGSYLINLAGRGAVRRRSLAALDDELSRCARLGVDFYVLHPGSPGQAGAEEGIARVAGGLNRAVARCRSRRLKVLLETTAGAGHMLGASFEQLAEILARLDRSGRGNRSTIRRGLSSRGKCITPSLPPSVPSPGLYPDRASRTVAAMVWALTPCREAFSLSI